MYFQGNEELGYSGCACICHPVLPYKEVQQILMELTMDQAL